ncbi:hypothetical protein D3C85_1592680 [compost metagenome]
MAYAAEIKRVQNLLHHAKQVSGDSNQANERIKSLSSRLQELQQLAGESTDSAAEVENESASEEVSEEVSEEAATEANEEVAAAEEQTDPEQ